MFKFRLSSGRRWRHCAAKLFDEVLEEFELWQVQDRRLHRSESDEHFQLCDILGCDWAGHSGIFGLFMFYGEVDFGVKLEFFDDLLT